MSEGLVIIVQARVGSHRFPAKVLQPLLGIPMLLWVLGRVSRVQLPHTLVVAAPATPENDALEALCQTHGYQCLRPDVPEDDVLARFAAVARHYDATEIVRVCGDSPCIDPQVLDALVAYHRWRHQPRPDHTGIAAEWPDGMDCEALSTDALYRAEAEATLPSDREHVTPYIWRAGGPFRTVQFPSQFNLQNVRWCVDTPDDLRSLERLVKHTMRRTGLEFTWRDLWATMLLEPSLAAQMQARTPRNYAYAEQVANERGEAVRSWENLRYQEPWKWTKS